MTKGIKGYNQHDQLRRHIEVHHPEKIEKGVKSEKRS